jgi:hypothetical protein
MTTPRDNRRTGDQVLIDNNAADLSDLTKRVVRLEQFVYYAIGAGAGVGMVVGLFAKQVARLLSSG